MKNKKSFIGLQLSINIPVIEELKDGDGDIAYQKFQDGSWARFIYNGKKLISSIEYSNGNWEEWSYNDQGLVSMYTCSDGSWERYVYDYKWDLVKTYSSVCWRGI